MASVTVHYLPDSRLAHKIDTGTHRFVSDEPQEKGGEDLGPSPYELLLSALGSCTAITLLIYARRHGWDLAGVSIDLEHERVERDDASQSDGGDHTEAIRSQISLQGELTDQQRERLLEIAGHCPVHRTLTSTSRPALIDSLMPEDR